MINRRNFAGTLGKWSLITALLSVTTACPFGSIYKTILEYIPVGLSALAAVLSILTGNGITLSPVIQAALDLVKTAFADVQVAVDQYQQSDPAGKATWLGKISEALTVAEANLQKFWADLALPQGKLADLIEGLLGIIISTLMGFQTQLPTSTTPIAMQARAMKATLGKAISVPAKVRSAKQFRTDFDMALANGGEGQHKI
jgi:hypothetical protein